MKFFDLYDKMQMKRKIFALKPNFQYIQFSISISFISISTFFLFSLLPSSWILFIFFSTYHHHHHQKEKKTIFHLYTVSRLVMPLIKFILLSHGLYFFVLYHEALLLVKQNRRDIVVEKERKNLNWLLHLFLHLFLLLLLFYFWLNSIKIKVSWKSFTVYVCSIWVLKLFNMH
jgi:hypothetical protein